MSAHLPHREAHPAAATHAAARLRSHHRGPDRGHLHPAGLGGHHAGRLGGGELYPQRQPGSGAGQRRGPAGGMPGWQITLIALGAALVAATVAVLLDRAHTARRAASAATT